MSNKFYTAQIEHRNPVFSNNGRKRGDHYTKQIKRFTRRRIRQQWRINQKDTTKQRYGWEY